MPLEDQLELISDQLDLLEVDHLIAKGEREKILAALKKEPDKVKEYSESFSKGLPSLTRGVIDLKKLGKNGDPIAISIASLDVFAGVVAMGGPLLGPLGPVLSALTGMISMILGEFLPKPPNLKDQIEELLNKFLAEEKLRDLGTAADQIWVLSDTIQNHSTGYKPLNLQHGTEIKAIDDAWQWLKQEDKQSLPQWDLVLEKTCMVWLQLMRCAALTVTKPSTNPGVAKNEMLVYLPARKELFLKYLRSIEPVAQERGVYVMMQAWADYGNVLYVALGRTGGLPWDYKKNTQWMVNFSIHRPRAQSGSSTPRYDLIACVDRPRMVVRHQVDSFTGGLYDGQPLMEDGHDYPNLQGGGTRRFLDCVDAWAFPDVADPTTLRVYTAHSGAYAYVNIHLVDSNNKVGRVNWEPDTAGGLRHIRALMYDTARSLPDDADAAGAPAGVYDLIYGGYSGNANIWVQFGNEWRDVPSPWGDYNGIEIDPHFLWVFGTKGLACATHASVMKASKERKNGNPISPAWITFKTGWQDGFNVRSLSPCANGILAVGSEQPYGLVFWTGPYKIHLKQARIEWNYQGTPRGGSPKQVHKMPIPCWSLFAKVKEDLEKEVGEGNGR